MAAQDDYNAARADLDAKGSAYVASAKTAYQTLKNSGYVGPGDLGLVRAAFRAVVGVMLWLCARLNHCAGQVPGVQPLSGGGPKIDDDPDNP
ncbi:MAG: hypothetical protein KAH44_05570 [Oricola sp.]|jgi:hypothetical protein|nr:hypothetical protein [Oricola sp.]